MEIEITRTVPQTQFLEDQHKFRAFVSGVGAGKTAGGWMAVLEYAFQNPGSLGAIIAPTYPLIRDVIIKERPNWVPDGLIKSYNKTDKELKFVNGSSLLFRSAKDDRQIELLRGLTLAFAWIDEATLLPKLILEILMARLRQPGYSPKLWMTCTPRMGWVHDLLVKNPTEEWFVLDNIPTFSNTNLDPGYVKSLKELYTGQFYDQEVMGKWTSFEGLIWDVVVSDIAPHKPSFTYYGIDIGYTHPSSIQVIQRAGGRFYVVDEFYQTHTNDDQLIHELKRLIGMYGDGISYVDPSVPRVISKIREAGLAARKADNSVMDGLRVVRALFDTHKLSVHPRCVNLIRESSLYVWQDKNKEMPIDINNDACFVPGTLITTDHGQVPIEQVQVGDLVLTRKGFRPVTAAAQTGTDSDVETILFSNNTTLTATANHPIFIEGKGFIPMSELSYGDITQCTIQSYGLKQMARFQKGITYITKTLTRLITPCQTLLVSLKKSIYRSMENETINRTKRAWISIWQTLDRILSSGMGQRPVLSGTVSTVRKHGLIERWSLRSVPAVDVSLKQRMLARTSTSVPTNAKHSTEEILRPTISQRHAQSAVQSSPVTSMIKSRPAQGSVQVSCNLGPSQSDVYNLTVADEHEYFANGILVSNCDGLRYGMMGATGKKMHRTAGVVRGTGS